MIETSRPARYRWLQQSTPPGSLVAFDGGGRRERSCCSGRVKAGRFRGVDPADAEEFLALFQAEHPDAGPIGPRVEEVRAQIERYGTYAHTAAELEFGARVAWRNSSRCIGRLYWRSLRVRDRRHVTGAAQVAAEAFAHLRQATNRGRVRPTVTVFAPGHPSGRDHGSGTSS